MCFIIITSLLPIKKGKIFKLKGYMHGWDISYLYILDMVYYRYAYILVTSLDHKPIILSVLCIPILIIDLADLPVPTSTTSHFYFPTCYSFLGLLLEALNLKLSYCKVP